MLVRIKAWLLRPGEQADAYLLLAGMFALLGAGFFLFNETGVHLSRQAVGLACFAIAGTCIAHWAHPRMWSWLVVFVPSYMFAGVLGWALAVDVIAQWRPASPPTLYPGEVVTTLAVIGLVVWLWRHRPRGEPAVGGTPRHT